MFVFQSRLPPMSRPFHMRCATRRSLVWLVTVLLLWQQVALAAYVCPHPSVIAGSEVAATVMTQRSCVDDMQTQPDQALCAKHCAPDNSAQPDARSPSVPACVLMALAPVLLAVGAVSCTGAALVPANQPPPDTPPARLLFCSLLI